MTNREKQNYLQALRVAYALNGLFYCPELKDVADPADPKTAYLIDDLTEAKKFRAYCVNRLPAQFTEPEYWEMGRYINDEYEALTGGFIPKDFYEVLLSAERLIIGSGFSALPLAEEKKRRKELTEECKGG